MATVLDEIERNAIRQGKKININHMSANHYHVLYHGWVTTRSILNSFYYVTLTRLICTVCTVLHNITTLLFFAFSASKPPQSVEFFFKPKNNVYISDALSVDSSSRKVLPLGKGLSMNSSEAADFMRQAHERITVDLWSS